VACCRAAASCSPTLPVQSSSPLLAITNRGGRWSLAPQALYNQPDDPLQFIANLVEDKLSKVRGVVLRAGVAAMRSVDVACMLLRCCSAVRASTPQTARRTSRWRRAAWFVLVSLGRRCNERRRGGAVVCRRPTRQSATDRRQSACRGEGAVLLACACPD
jgi:hypothetical protein